MSVTKNFRRNFSGETSYSVSFQSNPSANVKNRIDKSVKVSTTTVTYGENPKDYRLLIKKGVSATTSLTGVHRRIKSLDGHVSFLQTTPFNGIQEDTYGDVNFAAGGWVDPSGLISVEADNKARSKFLSHYIGLKNTFRGGNFLAEVRETIHMLAHPLKSFYTETWSLAERVKRLGKVYRKDRVGFGKALSDAWLAYAFGVKPLIADVNDATSALNQLAGGFVADHNGTIVERSDRQKLSGFGKEDVGGSTITAWTPPPGVSDRGVKVEVIVKTTNTARYYGMINAAPLNDDFVLSQFGIGVFDIVPAAWEAIPWSFFIDYFSNTGEMLDSLRLWSCDMGWCNLTVRNSRTQNIMFSSCPKDTSQQFVRAAGGRFYSLSTVVNRSKSAVPVPNWHFQMPGFPSLKWLNIAALARQVAGSKPIFSISSR